MKRKTRFHSLLAGDNSLTFDLAVRVAENPEPFTWPWPRTDRRAR